MRLINTATGKFQEFFDSQRPEYAILSHTWDGEEPSYLDVLFLTSDQPVHALQAVQTLLRNPSKDSDGYKKFQACCDVARSRGFEWVWIDSCCIDKSSSAELSEAINSMWSWYRDAAECCVYLSDVSITAKQLRSTKKGFSAFSQARWFSRGWTLQELLAPKKVVFYNNRWKVLADKAQIGKELSTITRIPLGFLDGTYDPTDCKLCSVAMKMSWLSRRQTTRIEDMAYCMFGLFDVNMPLIYGEGRKAFMRLQLEIIKKVDDDSIYAWTAEVDSSGLLATWPTAFAESGNIIQINFPQDYTPFLPPAMTSLGLEMRCRYSRYDDHQQAIDAQHNVRTVPMALSIDDYASIVMYCGPCKQEDEPVTQHWGPEDSGDALEIVLERKTSTWQRINCRKLDFVEYSMDGPDEADAYAIYYVEQQGL